MKKQNFMVKVGVLVAQIREKREITVGEACAILQVGPWQVKRYAEAVTDLCGDIRYDGRKFETVITQSQELANQIKLEQFKGN